MILIAGFTITEPGGRDAAVEAFAAMVEQARAQQGCLDLAISADSIDPDRVNLFECWRDEQSWKAWRRVAKGPRVKPKHAFVQLYRSDTAERLS